VESGDEAYRNRVLGKNLSDRQLWRTVTTLNRRGLDYLAFFMAGTPGETEETARKTLDMARPFVGQPLLIAWDSYRFNLRPAPRHGQQVDCLSPGLRVHHQAEPLCQERTDSLA